MLRAAWRFRSFIRGFSRAFAVGAFVVVLGALTDLAMPWPLKVIIDGAILHQPQTGWLPSLIAGRTPGPNVWNGQTWITLTPPQTILFRAVIATLLFVVVSAACDFSADMLMDGAGEKVAVAIRRATYAHVQRLSLSFHDRQRVGDLVSRVTLDIDRVQSMLVAVFDTLVPSVVTLVGIAVVMLWIDPGFGFMALAIAPPLFWVTYRYTMRMKLAARRARDADARIAAHTSETLGAVRSVQSFTREDFEDERFAALSDESLSASLEAVRLGAIFTPIVDIVSLGGILLVTYMGTIRVIGGTMSLGIFLVFLSYLRALYRPMRALSKMTYVVSRGTTSAERIELILKVEEKIPQRENAIAIERARGAIDLVDVTFQYRPELAPVIEGASLHIAAGEHVGIIGRTGAGKSTLVSLIPRFYDPDQGSVLIDGIDVRDLDLASLRRQVSLVLQEPVLFFGSILDNILYGDPTASMNRVWQCAKAAHVTEFLDLLPDGIETTIGERGVTLSGGQRQRIAVARSMLADAPILILDEPMTGLDQESEALVLDGLERLSRGRTTIVISHHAGALRDVTRVIHVGHGQLSESEPLGPDQLWPGAWLSPSDGADLEATADEIEERTFSTVSDGYAVHEVNAFLAGISARLRSSARDEQESQAGSSEPPMVRRLRPVADDPRTAG